jgi:hypothetical protein
MAYLVDNRNPSLLERIGQKVRGAAEVAGTLHGIYQAGKTIYQVGQAVAPLVGALL